MASNVLNKTHVVTIIAYVLFFSLGGEGGVRTSFDALKFLLAAFLYRNPKY
jgi:hypothetical protein